MKKVILLILIICLFPCIILAESYDYDNAVREGNNYINNTKFDNKNKYLLFNNIKYGFNDNGQLESNSRFTNGGFLNRLEYCISTGNSNCNEGSYLNIPISYWTMSGDSTNRYYISNVKGIDTKSDNSLLSARVTEYVKPEIEVKGNGTYSSPWEFSDAYFIELRTSNKALGHFGTKDNVKPAINGYAHKCENGNGYCYTVDIYTARGYRNDPSDGCNLVRGEVLEKTDTYDITRYTLSNITSDVNCVVKFRKVAYTVTFHDHYYKTTFEREVAVGDCFGPTEKFDDRIKDYNYKAGSTAWGTGGAAGNYYTSTHTLGGYCFTKKGNCGFAMYLGGFYGPIVLDANGYLKANTWLVDKNRCWIYEDNVDLYSFDRRWG